jgi:hypothetical protein
MQCVFPLPVQPPLPEKSEAGTPRMSEKTKSSYAARRFSFAAPKRPGREQQERKNKKPRLPEETGPHGRNFAGEENAESATGLAAARLGGVNVCTKIRPTAAASAARGRRT